ncbi:MAG: ABC transporter permease subunit [Chloroflexi bacterium]|nr:ABC transporter permease subunit [Chloroflexota bacterium]
MTLFIGVFFIILLANRPVTLGAQSIGPQLDDNLKRQIEVSIDFFKRDTPGFELLPEEEQVKQINTLRDQLLKDTGVTLPYLSRHLLWTFNALRFDWGDIKNIGIGTPPTLWIQRERSLNINSIILKYLPNTMLLAASANLLVFLLGLPLAMLLSTKYESWFDRLVAFLAPIFSIPSWVIGIFLIAIFSAWLRILPFSGMLDTLPPEKPIGYIPIVAKHMVLPVLSIFLSLFFQMLYSWRTFFLIYSEEEYVIMGKAVGLPGRNLRRDYILKPALPYIITSFSMVLISFWQMVMALEVIFNWPGIGWLFIKIGLPNFWGESMYPGELIIAITLIVIFAYLLGLIVFMLDLVYALVDPRAHLIQRAPALQQKKEKRKKIPDIQSAFLIRKNISQPAVKRKIPPVKGTHAIHLSNPFYGIANSVKTFYHLISQYPSVIVSLLIILLLVAGSVYAITAMPYGSVGEEWLSSTMTGQPLVPKLAIPQWVNLFRMNDLLSRIILDSSKGDGEISTTNWNGTSAEKTITFTFNYDHQDFPSEIFLYLDGHYSMKKSFVIPVWITPDGREIQLKGTSIGIGTMIPIGNAINARRWVVKDLAWQNWFTFGQVHPTPVHYIFFAQPGNDKAEVMQGEYTFRLDGITFEEGNDIEARLVILGTVYGLAGTDHYRRDLATPLLWGMPIALGTGLLGSLLTTSLSIIFAAAGVWYGGWVDDLIQRITEINLILPVLAISVLAYAYLHVSLWIIIGIIILLNTFGSPTKNFRSAFLSIKNAEYIEAAIAYGASNMRVILRYMVPRLIPTLIPQLIVLIPTFVFLEVSLGLFNISTGYPTWGMIIYEGIRNNALYYGQHRLLEPLALVLLTGISFSLLGFTLERILNPRLLRQ